MAARAGEGAGRAWSRARAAADVASSGRPTCPLPRPVATLPCGSDPNMAAPSKRRNGEGASWWAALLLAAVALRPGEAVSEPTTVAFDVRPGGVVHSFSQNVGPGDKYTCTFTYASQGGTNEVRSRDQRGRALHKAKIKAAAGQLSSPGSFELSAELSSSPRTTEVPISWWLFSPAAGGRRGNKIRNIRRM
ncbi:myeloid-derived growth factor isoform X2 [Prionailurus viverrinus]|uniref:myeloid-derived growth factor isoform X2 n=1 Tax=Prionailurus viverrinus TaxID=61388 RepID=UPI001FF29F90|nr:myeloid-derived growth factor isoform X2 [Prionailurus viverrinus]